ncbi:hypothetical protein RYX36_021993, partial [Vicia faba]
LVYGDFDFEGVAVMKVMGVMAEGVWRLGSFDRFWTATFGRVMAVCSRAATCL